MANNRLIAKLGLMAAIAFSTTMGMAFYDTDILIQRALNSPDFTVKYSGASAAMVELRVNGSSIGTQTVSPGKTSGEVVFTLDLLNLNDGDNVVEVRLFDRNGKLLGTQRMNVLAGDGEPSPVKLTGAKTGATVQGAFELKVGFGKDMRNAYVSFFVDEQFKSMTNAAPYSYYWDTLGELNGWHELEAWVVDENSVTYKTRKIRVYVNNPGGRTNRQDPAQVATTVTTAANTAKAVKSTSQAVKSASGAAKSVGTTAKTVAGNTAKAVQATNAAKTVATTAKAATNAVTTISSPAKTTVVADLTTAVNGIKMVTSQSVGLKSTQGSKTLVANAKLMTPKSIPTKLDKLANTDMTNVRNVMTAAGTISITRGARLPNMGSYSIVMNSKTVKFDVQPRVQDGIPLAPVRHLFEANGGKVDWQNLTKTLFGEVNGKKIVVKIGDRVATIDKIDVELEAIPFLENGRTIVPLSFIRDSMQVDIEFDRKTGHVLITSIKKK